MEKISEHIVCKLFGKHIESKAQKEIYTYGMTLLITTMLGIISILILSAIFFDIIAGVVFLTVFSLLRIHTGGYHCKTYAGCFVVSNLIFLIVAIVSKSVQIANPLIIVFLNLVFLILSWIYIIINSPVINANHRLSQKKINRNRKRAVVLATVISIIGILGTVFFSEQSMIIYYCTIVAMTEAVVFVLMLILKIKERRYKNV